MRRRRQMLALAAVVAAVAVLVWRIDQPTSRPHVPGVASTYAPRDASPVRETPVESRRRYTVSRAAVPILMYHVIAPPFATSPYPGLYVPPGEFAAQMRALAGAGFHAVTLDRVWAAWHGEATLPAKPVVLTFDNGYRTQETEALPVLRRLGWVGVENLQLTGLPPQQGGLSRRQVRALLEAGWELDTQGYNHADLNSLDAQQLHFQIADTRRTLRRRYHAPVRWFCYPSGHYDAAVIAAVRAAGFVGSTTVVPGWARRGGDPFRLPRLRVLGGTTPAQLLAQIADSRDAPPPPVTYPAG